MPKRKRGRLTRQLFAGLVVAALVVTAVGQQRESERIKRVIVPADAGWVDTGLEGAQGDEFYFQALGEITLQRGNPVATCGPAGLDLKTVQQPILDQNLGALIGKVSQLVSVKIDEDTGEEIRDEIISLFFVGSGGRVIIPMRGRLYLGINENVVKDNAGMFTVFIEKLGF